MATELERTTAQAVIDAAIAADVAVAAMRTACDNLYAAERAARQANGENGNRGGASFKPSQAGIAAYAAQIITDRRPALLSVEDQARHGWSHLLSVEEG